MPNVSNVVKSIQDIMRKDAGTYGDAQRLEQLGWMFFLKIFDDREQEMELLLNAYKSPLPQPLRGKLILFEGIDGSGKATTTSPNSRAGPKPNIATGCGGWDTKNWESCGPI